MISTDIVIVGGGCVGLTLALALAQNHIPVVVIDGQPEQQPLTEQPELRVSAISGASTALFTRLGVWQDILNTRACSYQSMYVWEKDSFGDIRFDAEQIHQAQLGHIVENKVIRNALIKQLANYGSVATLLFEQQVTQINATEREVLVTLASGQPVIGRLLVAADGANSFVRQQMNMPLTFWDYEHSALVATIQTEHSHDHCAAQCFLPAGPLAFLPLNADASGRHRCSIVWSTSPEQAEQLRDCDEQTFNQLLTTAFDGRLGLCQVQSPRAIFPLKMRYARRWVKPRVALIGDAAHTIHPLAGLGMNLGLLDAATLAQTLIDTMAQGRDPGLVQHLRSFERWRKAEAQTLIAAMEALKRLFGNDHGLLKILRNSGLTMIDKMPSAKQQIIRRAMGLSGDLPPLAQPLIDQ